jgi:hypothetical protein
MYVMVIYDIVVGKEGGRREEKEREWLFQQLTR